MGACPVIHPLALRHLQELKERWGVEPTLAESLWVVRLCDRVLSPNEGERADLCGMPARAGVSDVWLWPITIGASVWVQDYAQKWWGQDDERMYMAFCFALANGRKRDAMREASLSPERAADLVGAWALGLNCTNEELHAAFNIVVPGKPKGAKENTASKIDWDAVVGELEASTGIPADHWLWDVSKDATLRAFHRAKQVTIARAGGGSAGDMLDPLTRALQELAEAKGAIIEAHKQQEGAANG